MIRSIPNPPMGTDDIIRFREIMDKAIHGNFSMQEREHIEQINARTRANAKRVLANCGGKNPILGY